jgi:Spy/CpxP family protein refolding chaperone
MRPDQEEEKKCLQLFCGCAVGSSMKTTLTLIAVAALAMTSANTMAQTPAPADSGATQGGKHSKHDGKGPLAALNLTPDQKAKLAVLRTDFRSKADVIRSNTALTPEQKKEQIKALREANKTQVEAILTPEQLAQLQKLKAERKEHRKHGGDAAPQTSPAE